MFRVSGVRLYRQRNLKIFALHEKYILARLETLLSTFLQTVPQQKHI